MPSRSSELNNPSPTQVNPYGLENVALCPLWMVRLMRITGICHVLLGIVAVISPFTFFDIFRVTTPQYAEPVQAIGAVVASLGLACVLAAPYAIQNWPLILAGMFSYASVALCAFQAGLQHHLRSTFTQAFIGTAVFWSVVFGAMLVRSFKAYVGARRVTSPEVQQFALRVRTNHGTSLLQLSKEHPIMLLFLRHAGCMFCREALSDVAAHRKQIEASGTRIVLVHMSRDSHAGSLFRKYGLEDLPRVSDPQRALYRAFGLGRGGLLQLAGPAVWLRAIRAAIFNGHGVGKAAGDVFQMPGVFIVYHGHVVRSFVHHSVADRPDYRGFVALQNVPIPER